ncbi:MAG: Rieske 2Fe-2S domain-containing protein [Proteobacteria bacterium]|nr:Rieske 2Fe-2S domain-containing protein [Pseudomonadota bacterium]
MVETPAIDFEWPAKGLTRIPYQLFNDQNIYDAEQHRLFRGETWHYLGLGIELPSPGDFKTTFLGETPIIVCRDKNGELNAFVNRCAHRGAMVCHHQSGNRKVFTCPYHNWSFDQKGNLVGVAFRNGVRGEGGMPASFNLADHGLETLRVDVFHDVIFGTFSNCVAPVETYLGPDLRHHISRVFNRPMKVLGHYSQFFRNNWKMYMENVRDPYHASILHLFFGSFGLSRHTMDGAALLDERGWHSVVYTKRATDDIRGSEYEGDLPSVKTGLVLEDPSLIAGWPEFDDKITNCLMTVFPSVTFQQISNCLGVRHIVPRSVDTSELFWTLLGYADEDEKQTRIRIKQSNLYGPAGLVALEDGAVTNMVQRGILGADKDEASIVELGGEGYESGTNRVTETVLRGFWKAYRETMGV